MKHSTITTPLLYFSSLSQLYCTFSTFHSSLSFSFHTFPIQFLVSALHSTLHSKPFSSNTHIQSCHSQFLSLFLRPKFLLNLSHLHHQRTIHRHTHTHTQTHNFQHNTCIQTTNIILSHFPFLPKLSTTKRQAIVQYGELINL